MTAMWQADLLDYFEKYEFHAATKKLQSFCSEDLSAFYFDILKDRLYTAAKDAKARRSAQNALYHMAQSLVRLMAPVLSFTAEEAWKYIALDQSDSVFLSTWYSFPDYKGEMHLVDKLIRIRAVLAEELKHVGEPRPSGTIGSSFATAVEFC